MDGFFNIYKEKGYTSFDVCNKIKHMFHEKKIGHTGTLDPNAVGVMQIAVGRATKLLPLLEDHTKVYEPTIHFGILTDTLDPEGKIIEEASVPSFSLSDVKAKLEILKGRTTQLPPIYSAIKVNGRKLYEYARENKDVEIKERPVKIYELDTVSDLYYEDGYLALKLHMKVSKGFYVRSLVRDLATLLNTIAIMSDLVRIETGDFKLKDAIRLSHLKESNLISVEDVFLKYPRFDAKDYLVPLIKNGIMLDERQMSCRSPFTVYHNNKLLAIYAPLDDNNYYRVQYFGD